MADGASPGDIKRWREAEIKHGRVAMLASLGVIVAEVRRFKSSMILIVILFETAYTCLRTCRMNTLDCSYNLKREQSISFNVGCHVSSFVLLRDYVANLIPEQKRDVPSYSLVGIIEARPPRSSTAVISSSPVRHAELGERTAAYLATLYHMTRPARCELNKPNTKERLRCLLLV